MIREIAVISSAWAGRICVWSGLNPGRRSGMPLLLSGPIPSAGIMMRYNALLSGGALACGAPLGDEDP
jgi:hypothetical protein